MLWGRRVVTANALGIACILRMHVSNEGAGLLLCLVAWTGSGHRRYCLECIKTQDTPPVNPLLLWPWATEPWQRICLDFTEVKCQQLFFLVVGGDSKWLEVIPMQSTIANATIAVMRSLVVRYGLLRQVVRSKFIAAYFKSYLKENRIKYTPCPPNHPADNGLAEKQQTFKRMFSKFSTECDSTAYSC